MQLRPRQEVFVNKCISALEKYGNTLGIAIVGFGKTVCLSAVIKNYIELKNYKVLVLQHRTELKNQNNDKFFRFTKGEYKTSFVQGSKKDFSGKIVFGMAQTIGRSLALLPKFDMVVIDETHRVLGEQYLNIIEHLKTLNKDIKIFGVTATPRRGDGQGLKKVFSNVADVVTIQEVISSGHLVMPRTYSLDMGQISKLMNVQKTSSGEYDQDSVSEILNKAEITEGVFKYWNEIAKNRKTIAFCATVNYAKSLKEFFDKRGIETALVHGTLSKKEREEEIKKYEKGTATIMFNVAVFTEGYDYPPTSCVMLLRQSSYHGTMVQMIGRGLRTVDEKEYPGVEKTDCIILDFGVSTTIHGSLESSTSLEDSQSKEKEELEEIQEKMCPQCLCVIPLKAKECPVCGFKDEEKLKIKRKELKLPLDFDLVEVNLLSQASFVFEGFLDDTIWIADTFEGTAFVVKKNNEYQCFVRLKLNGSLNQMLSGNRYQCFYSANEWLNKTLVEKKGKKGQTWQTLSMSDKQLDWFKKNHKNWEKYKNISRYRANCLRLLMMCYDHIA